MSEKRKIVMIEDDPKSIDHYKALLENKSNFDVTGILLESINDVFKVKDMNPDSILLDYNLKKTSRFFGSALTSFLISELPNVPIILITDPDILYDRKEHILDEISNIDEIIYKTEIDKDPIKIISFLNEIIDGFKKLNKIERIEVKKLYKIMKSKYEEEVNVINNFWQYYNQIDVVVKNDYSKKSDFLIISTPHQIAKGILQILLKNPGIFYNTLYSATFLGLTTESFEHPKVKTYFKDSKYDGVFSGITEMWWKTRLLSKAYELIYKTGFKPPISLNFSQAFEKAFGIKLEPALDYQTGEPFANTVCVLLKQPFLRKNTLEIRMDAKPDFLDTPRASIQGITETDFNVGLLTEEGKRIISEL